MPNLIFIKSTGIHWSLPNLCHRNIEQVKFIWNQTNNFMHNMNEHKYIDTNDED